MQISGFADLALSGTFEQDAHAARMLAQMRGMIGAGVWRPQQASLLAARLTSQRQAPAASELTAAAHPVRLHWGMNS